MKFRILLAGSALVSVLALGACDAIVFGGNSQLTQSRAELYNDQFATEIGTGALNEGQVTELARHYWSNNNGPMIVSVTFDPQSRTNTAKKASTEALKLATAFKAKGVRNVQYGTTAIADSGAISRTMISYDTVKARPPKDCPEPLSMDFSDTDREPDYKIGCSVETYTARQIARPADLAGQGVMDNNSGRRDANVLEGYQSGQPNPELTGANASESGK